MAWHHIMYVFAILKKTADSVFSYFHSVLKGRKVYYLCSIAVIAFIYSFFCFENNSTKPESESDCRMNTELFVPPSGLWLNVLPLNSRIQAGWWAVCHQQPLHLKTDFTYKPWVIYLRICTISSLLVPPCTETQMLFSDQPYTCTHGTHSQITFHLKNCNRVEDTYANVMLINGDLWTLNFHVQRTLSGISWGSECSCDLYYLLYICNNVQCYMLVNFIHIN